MTGKKPEQRNYSVYGSVIGTIILKLISKKRNVKI